MPFGGAHFDLRQLMGSLRSTGTPGHEAQETLTRWPFITISRQAGSGGRVVGRQLAEALNRRDKPDHPWQCLDRELVERIARDHHVSTELVDSLEKSSHTWVSDFLTSLTVSSESSPSDMALLKRVAETVRGLARAGHVILIGQAPVFITRDMPGGLHVRLVAPLDWRIKNLARMEGIKEDEARDRVKLIDRDREGMVARFWPGSHMSPELFHITLNAGMLNEEQMAAALAPLIRPTG